MQTWNREARYLACGRLRSNHAGMPVTLPWESDVDMHREGFQPAYVRPSMPSLNAEECTAHQISNAGMIRRKRCLCRCRKGEPEWRWPKNLAQLRGQDESHGTPAAITCCLHIVFLRFSWHYAAQDSARSAIFAIISMSLVGTGFQIGEERAGWHDFPHRKVRR